MNSDSHQRSITQEFTRRADAFATAPPITNPEALKLLLQLSEAGALNRMEPLRDSSHIRALPVEEIENLLRRAGLRISERTLYGLDWELETVLRGSSINSEDLASIRRLFEVDLEFDRMAVQVRREQLEIWFTYPIVVIAARKPSVSAAPHRTRS
jgi:hypothetical protein